MVGAWGRLTYGAVPRTDSSGCGCQKISNTPGNMDVFTLGVIALVSYLFTPYAGKFLMFNVRFAYPAVMLLLLTGVAALTQAGVSSSALTLAILVTQIGGFFFSRFPVTSFSGLLLSLLALAIPVILLLHKKLPKSSYAPSKMRQIMTIAAYIAVGLFLVTTLHNHRDKSRYSPGLIAKFHITP